MGKYLKKFDNHTQYEAFIGGGVEAVELYGEFIEPNVSHCIEENEVYYNPKRYYITCTYNVTDDTQPTRLYHYQGYPYIIIFGVNMFDIAYIDGKEVSIEDLDAAEGNYQLSAGEHTVKFALKDPTTISKEAFYYCTSITNITIPNSVRYIDYNAFFGCTGLTNIIIPSSVTSIGSFAFNSCSNLTSVTIPGSVTSFGGESFAYTPWWEIYAADTNNQYGNIIYINDVAVQAVSRSITSCEFKEGTVSIGGRCFINCNAITSLDIPSGILNIGENAFENCTGLTSVIIPNSVTSIGYGAFYLCESLESVNIPDGITSIEDSTFSECYSLTSIDIPDSVTSIGENAFSYCSGLTSITIPNSVRNIGGAAFSYCESVSSITINALTPPALEDGESTFNDTNNCPIYVPSGSVNVYKTAEGWSTYASRIQPIPTT